MGSNGNIAARMSNVKKDLDVNLRPEDVMRRLGEKDWELLAAYRKIAVLEARVDELEAGLPEDPDVEDEEL